MWRWSRVRCAADALRFFAEVRQRAGGRAQWRRLLLRPFCLSDNKLGNIMQKNLSSLVSSPQQTRFGNAKEFALPSDCRQCDVRFACNGECPKHRFMTTASGEYGLNYLCAGYKHFFHHIDPYMRFMAEELKQNRAPARVMEWARRGEVRAS